MFKGLYILIFFLVSVLSILAQINPGARQIAMSNSDVALSDDAFSVFNNPSGLSQMDWREIGLYYSPAPFGIKELANGYLCYHEPSELGSFGLGIMTYGFDLFRENQIILGYSNFYKDFYLGGAVKYHQISIMNYGSTHTFAFNIGSMIFLSDEIRWGIFFDNLTRSTIGYNKEQIPFGYTTGLTYVPASELIVCLATEKAEHYDFSLKLGIEYNLFKHIYLRSGFSTEPDRFSAGIGISYGYFQFDYSVFTHLELGLTHQAGFIIHFSDDEPRTIKINKRRHGGS